jgi:uncharacterized membrane protein YtjA (UPF0391 family)
VFLRWCLQGNAVVARVYKHIGKNQNFKIMLRLTITFLVIAIIAAILGFGGIAAGAAAIAKIVFFLFLVAFVISLLAGAFRKN